MFWAALALGVIIGAGIAGDLAYNAGRAAFSIEEH
jgi:hypothetical protein